MITKTETVKLAFILALNELKNPLSEIETENIQNVAKTLSNYSESDNWQDLELIFLPKIETNSKLNQIYHNYKSKLDQIDEIPLELLPKFEEVEEISQKGSILRVRSGKPTSKATGYEYSLNNVLIVIEESDQLQETVRQLKFIDKLIQFLNTKII